MVVTVKFLDIVREDPTISTRQIAVKAGVSNAIVTTEHLLWFRDQGGTLSFGHNLADELISIFFINP